ncbi:MAG: exodeoxyribonuclease III [Hyphomicrobiaceae bacterium]
MKIASWNINGIKARIDNLPKWLMEASPDVVCLQEIKSIDENFPSAVFEELGYNVAVHGQKSFNGVALLSKHPLEDVRRGLPGDDDDVQARYIEANVTVNDMTVRVAGIYLPNGNPLGTEKFDYKLAWMDRLYAHAQATLLNEELFLIAGDYNVIPDPVDCRKPENWLDDALYQPESRDAYRDLVHLGMTDALRATNPAPETYTFWDYQAGAWNKNNGIRIDHILLSPQAADRLSTCAIDKHTRGWEKPSDHVPIWVELSAPAST